MPFASPLAVRLPVNLGSVEKVGECVGVPARLAVPLYRRLSLAGALLAVFFAAAFLVVFFATTSLVVSFAAFFLVLFAA